MDSTTLLKSLGGLLSREDSEFHRETIADILQRHNKSFPGAQPVSFCRHHIDELQSRDYFMCEKTDGLRCLLYLTAIPDGETGQPIEMQFLIDRKNDYYYVTRDRIHVPHPADMTGHHMGTILDGELVQQNFKDGRPPRLAYLIFDCLAILNENVTNRPFDKRLARIQENVAKPIREFAKRYPAEIEIQPFQIEMKGMEFPYGMEMMFKDKIPNLPHGNDGLIFTCKDTPYVAGTDQHILKWKPPLENTIDFRLLLGDFPMIEDDEGRFEDFEAQPEMELHINHGGSKGYAFFASLQLNESEWSTLKAQNQQIDGRIIECYRDPVKGTWRPKLDNGAPRFRDDKTDANFISTVDSVLQSIKDAVTEQDLVAAAPGIRNAFKARAAKQKAREEELKKAEEAERRRREEERRRASETAAIDDGPKYED